MKWHITVCYAVYSLGYSLGVAEEKQIDVNTKKQTNIRKVR